jgi:hypothetical protein
MGAFNTIQEVSCLCPKCHSPVSIDVQFKYGGTRQPIYVVGDRLHGGANDIGSEKNEIVVVDGASGSSCSLCGYADDWDFYVYIVRGRIVHLVSANGQYKFANDLKSYFVLSPACD